MKKKYFLFLLLTTLFTLNSCSSFLDPNKAQTDKTIKMMETWIGSTKQDLLLKWGSPDSITSDGNGGEIVSFYEYDKVMVYDTLITRRYTYSFYIDAQQKIYHGKPVVHYHARFIFRLFIFLPKRNLFRY